MNNSNTEERRYWPQFDAYIKRVIKGAKCNLVRQQVKAQNMISVDDDLLMALVDRGHVEDYPSDHYCLNLNGKAYSLDDEHLFRAMEQLPEKLVHVLVLKFWHQDSEKEIADHLQVSVRSCYTRRKQALAILKAYRVKFYANNKQDQS